MTLDRSLGLSGLQLLLHKVAGEDKEEFVAGTSGTSPSLALVSFFKRNFVFKERKQASPLLNYFTAGQVVSWFFLVLGTSPSHKFPRPGFGNHRPRAPQLQPEHLMLGRCRREGRRWRGLGNH